MRLVKLLLITTLLLQICIPAQAKKYKFKFDSHPIEIYTIGRGTSNSHLVKAWGVGKNADKAIDQAKIDAVVAAFFNGISPDASTHGMGAATLAPLTDSQHYLDNKETFDTFFKSGHFLQYVTPVNSSYPSGENNLGVPGGRRVGINLRLDYNGLRKWLEDKHIIKGFGNYFHD